MNKYNFEKNAVHEPDWEYVEKRRNMLLERLDEKPDRHILFIGSLNCLRHKPFRNVGKLMQQRKVSILTPSMGDFSSGKYIEQLEEAIESLALELDCSKFLIICGCQWVILSTDEELIVSHMSSKGVDIEIELDDPLGLWDGCRNNIH